jgi:transposase
VHKIGGLCEWLAERGVEALFLPPYSPDFSPIEQAWSKLKTKLRAGTARCYETLQETLHKAIDWISSQDARNWFGHYAYHTQPA